MASITYFGDCNVAQVYQNPKVGNDGPTYTVVKDLKKATQERLLDRYIEDVGYDSKNIVCITRMDGLAQAMHIAYSNHNTFVWSPDALWLRISQALATHIRLNSVELHSKIIGFEGKKELRYRNDSFVKDQPNPWSMLLSSMARQISENTNGPLHSLLTKPYSTTRQIHTIAANGMLMDACSDYFAYTMTTQCGIPEFHFTGTKQDWKDLFTRCEQLKYYGMSKWYHVLQPILSEFMNVTLNGIFNTEFWCDMYKIDGESGGPYISGWVNQLYPYLNNDVQNHYLYNAATSSMEGITTAEFPSGLSSVPFKWQYEHRIFNMELVVGAMGVQQDPKDRSISPAYGWAIIDKAKSTNPKN